MSRVQPGAARNDDSNSSEVASSDTASSDVQPSARRQATRDRLLEAATETFAKEGFQGASVESICTRAGFTRGAFYSNFESKEELFLALLEREYVRRAKDLESKTQELAPSLRESQGRIDAEQAADYIADFLLPHGDAIAWYVLETEFALLAMRDPEGARGKAPAAREYTELLARSRASMAGLVEAAITAAGRRFTLPAEHAIAILTGEYERALRLSVLEDSDHTTESGRTAGLTGLPALISELLFAITEESAGALDVPPQR